MKIIKLFLLFSLGLWADLKLDVNSNIDAFEDQETSFIKEIRKNFDHTQYRFDANITKISDIKDTQKKEKLLEILQSLFSIYLEEKNPLSMIDYDVYSETNKHYPLVRITKFLELTALYINEFNEEHVSSLLLEKTLFSINQTKENIESASLYTQALFLEQYFLKNMECKSTKIETILIENTRINIGWDRILKKEKNKFIQSLMHQIRTSVVKNTEIKLDIYMAKIKTILSREIDEFNIKILLILENNISNKDNDMEYFIQKKEEEVDTLASQIKTRVNKNMTMDDFIKVPQNLHDLIELNGRKSALAYMYIISPLGSASPKEVYMKKLYTNILDSCTN